MSSLKKDAKGERKWNNGKEPVKAGWEKNHPKDDEGDCAGLKKGKLLSIKCEKPSNFMCEGKKPEKYVRVYTLY
jgi:hypothetical protein